MVSRPTAAALNRQYNQNRNDIEGPHNRLDKTDELAKDTNTKVDNLTTQVAGLSGQMAGISEQVAVVSPRYRVSEPT